MYDDVVVRQSAAGKVQKVMFSVRLDPGQIQLLRDIKERDGIPESEQIRRGLALWFAQKEVLKTRRKTT